MVFLSLQTGESAPIYTGDWIEPPYQATATEHPATYNVSASDSFDREPVESNSNHPGSADAPVAEPVDQGDELGHSSFPASDSPAIWTWDPPAVWEVAN